MPGLYGLVLSNKNSNKPNSMQMLSELSYAYTVVEENYKNEAVSMGCVHAGTGGQRALYETNDVAVLFFGYLTQPVIPPGSDGNDFAAAAHLIHDLYLAHGESMLNEIGGAFALAIWDARTRTLLLANDKLGLRPIYYAEHAGIFRFSSEVKGILSDPTFPRHLNRQAISEFVQLNFIMGEKTLFENIQLLPPASILRYQHNRMIIKSYWDIPFPSCYPQHSDRYYDDLIYNAMQKAVKRMLRNELKYGLSLSGGLDSRWIAALLAESKSDSRAFTLGTHGSDDTPPAEAVAEATGLKHHLWEVPQNLVSEMGELYAYLTDGMDSLWHMEEFPLTIRIGKYVDVSVGGFLGDGLFGYEINPVSAYLRKQDVAKYRRWRIQSSRPSHYLMKKVFKDNIGKEFEDHAMESLNAAYANSAGNRGFQAIQHYDLRQAERRMAFTAQLAKLAFVDIYHPIADEDVVLAALQLPPSQLMFERAYRRSMGKHLPDMAKIPWTFTLTLPTISIPGIVAKKAAQLTLGKYLQNTSLGNHPLIRQRRYYVNYTQWSRSILKLFIEKSLLSPEMESLGLFDMQGLKEVVHNHFDGTRIVTSFLGVALSLSLWARIFYSPSTPIRPDILKKRGWEKGSS